LAFIADDLSRSPKIDSPIPLAAEPEVQNKQSAKHQQNNELTHIRTRLLLGVLQEAG
jgi:hypothetical protein